MDIRRYREDEQFSLPSDYLDTNSSDSTSFETSDQNELFEDIRPMPQPPRDIFEWHTDGEKESHCNTDSSPLTNEDHEDSSDDSSTTQEDLHKIFELQNFQPIWQPILNTKVEQLPIGEEIIPNDEEMAVDSHTNSAYLQEILELPEIVNNLNPPHITKLSNTIEPTYENRISEYSDTNITESKGDRTRISESSDILNTSFNSTDITNFDIAEYIFEENKQSKQSMHESKLITNKVKTSEMPKRAIKAAVKKIDLKAQKYIIDKKKSLSEDDEIDVETVSEEEYAPVLEAGDLTDLLEQFEASEIKNNEQNLNLGCNIQQNLSLKVKVEVKTEKDIFMPCTKTLVKVEPNNAQEEKIISSRIIKQEKMQYEEFEEANIQGNKDQANIPSNPSNACQVQLIINNKPIFEPVVKPQETTTSSKTPYLSNNRHIIDSLPQELINRIKESGKRKPITVIQAIPNNRKRSKIQEVHKPFHSNGSNPNTVHLDHNYCSPSGIINQINKKDSGFVSSEEDDRTIISRQPTVKNADGTLMVSLLKANTIRHVESSANQKKKLNFEEYKKRRNGFLTPNSNSQSCSPSTSTCSSPLPEDDHQKMLKHQEKLRRMAEEVLNAAPKSEKKVDINTSALKVPILIPPSPVTYTTTEPVASMTEFAVIGEIPIKTEHTDKVDLSDKVELSVKVDVPNNMIVPKIPPNLERKVLVSFGVNTDFKIANNEDPLAPVEKLEEIKPLLKKASDKINENSLISSVIENIPKVIGKNGKPNNTHILSEPDHYEHGENKQVLHLERDRVRCETKDAETQTNISLIEQTKRGRIRRRISSSSSCSSYKSKNSTSSRRSRKCSNSSSSSSSRSSNSSRRSNSSSGSSDYSSRLSYSRSRSRSPHYSSRRRNGSAEREHLNAVEERRIIYVGRIGTSTSKEDLKKKFYKFGPINKISLHFRDSGYNHLENYGFVTFKYKEDAHEAYEHGNDDPAFPYYKISFGGRREFCKAAYSDLDNMRDECYYQVQSAGDSYDKLLKEALEKLKRRKV